MAIYTTLSPSPEIVGLYQNISKKKYFALKLVKRTFKSP